MGNESYKHIIEGKYIVGFSNDIIPKNYKLKPLPIKSKKVIFKDLHDLLEKDVSIAVVILQLLATQQYVFEHSVTVRHCQFGNNTSEIAHLHSHAALVLQRKNFRFHFVSLLFFRGPETQKQRQRQPQTSRQFDS